MKNKKGILKQKNMKSCFAVVYMQALHIMIGRFRTSRISKKSNPCKNKTYLDTAYVLKNICIYPKQAVKPWRPPMQSGRPGYLQTMHKRKNVSWWWAVSVCLCIRPIHVFFIDKEAAAWKHIKHISLPYHEMILIWHLFHDCGNSKFLSKTKGHVFWLFLQDIFLGYGTLFI